LRHVQAQVASLLIAGLEPVFAIVFALFLLGETPSLQTMLGGLLIVGTTFLATSKANLKINTVTEFIKKLSEKNEKRS